MIMEFKIFGSHKKAFVDKNNGFILGVFRDYGIWGDILVSIKHFKDKWGKYRLL